MNDEVFTKIMTMNMNEMELVFVNPVDLMAHPENRGIGSEEAMAELMLSIQEVGVIQPLQVWRPEGEMFYQILAGHRRAEAARRLGMKSVRCLVRECTEEEAMAFLFVENFERVNLNPIEEAEGLDAWMRLCGVDATAVAKRISRPVGYVQAVLKLNDLPTEARKLVREGGVSKETLLLLGEVEGDDFERAVQLVLFPSFQAQPLSARQAGQVIREEIEIPRKRVLAWDGGREALQKKLAKKWSPLVVSVPGLVEAEEMLREHDYVSAEVIPYVHFRDGFECSWGALAVRHGLQGHALPGHKDVPVVMVRGDLIREGERAMHAAGMESWFYAESEKSTGKKVEQDEADDFPEDDPVPPAEERHVRREAGMVLVPKERLERARDLCVVMQERVLTVDECLDLPSVLAEAEITEPMVLRQKIVVAKVVLDWVLEGCPVVGVRGEIEGNAKGHPIR